MVQKQNRHNQNRFAHGEPIPAARPLILKGGWPARGVAGGVDGNPEWVVEVTAAGREVARPATAKKLRGEVVCQQAAGTERVNRTGIAQERVVVSLAWTIYIQATIAIVVGNVPYY